MDKKMSTDDVTVLVTGGTGLIGSAVKNAALSDPYGVWVFVGRQDADLLSFDETLALFRRVRPTHVLHLAARVGGLFSNMKDNLAFYRDNMKMQDNVNECCVRCAVEKMVSCLSSCVFPDDVTYPIREADLHEGPPHHSNFGYAYAKRMVDIQNQLYNESGTTGCLFTSVIPTNAYGRGDNFNLENAHVIPALIAKCHVAKQSGRDFVVAGSGRPLRQFVYADDLARLMIWALDTYDRTSPVILADTREYSISEVAHEIAAAMQFGGKIVFDAQQADGQLRKTVSNDLLCSYMPDFSFTDMRDGLRQTVEWFLANQEDVRR